MKSIHVPDAPSKFKLYKYITKEIEKLEASKRPLLGFNEATLPDKAFLVNLLFNMNKDHKIFNKSYQSKKKKH